VTTPAEAVRRIRAVPAELRTFAVPAGAARQVHGIGPDLLGALIGLGLPREDTPDGPLFDQLDLLNVSAALALRSAWRIGQRGWRPALAAARAGTAVGWEVTVEPRCPWPGHPGGCDFDLLLTRGRGEPSAGAQAELIGARGLRVTTGGAAADADDAAAAALSCLDGVAYLHLPEQLDRDPGFLDRTGLASCVSACEAVAARAAELGVPARRSAGLALVSPYAGLHAWVEFRVGGRWHAFDPHLVAFLEESGVLAPGEWPPLRSLSPVLLRLSCTPRSMARHGGLHAEVSFALRRRP
jgi:hypothetical protein